VQSEVERLNDVIEKKGLAKTRKDIKNMKNILQLFRKSHAEMKSQLKEQLTEEVQEKLAETTKDLDRMKLQMNASNARVDQANEELKEMVFQLVGQANGQIEEMKKQLQREVGSSNDKNETKGLAKAKEDMNDMKKQFQLFADAQAEMQLKLMEQFAEAQLELADVETKEMMHKLQMEVVSLKDKMEMKCLTKAIKDIKVMKEKFQLLQDGQAAMKLQLKEKLTHEMQEKLAEYKSVLLERTQPLAEIALLRVLANASEGNKR
ncbi:unnamed protein product, partial [Prorocentrum cordatum]